LAWLFLVGIGKRRTSLENIRQSYRKGVGTAKVLFKNKGHFPDKSHGTNQTIT
jgi:hypothetical protein